MRSFFRNLFVLGFCLVLVVVPIGSAEEKPLFLLGQNEKAEVILPSGKVVTLEIGLNPLQVLTGNKGQKLILCAGETDKSGEIKQGASLRLMTEDLTAFEKTVQFDSSLTGFTINKDVSTIWLATGGGKFKKEDIKPKIYRVCLDSYSVTEAVLDSVPCEIALSGDGRWLAVASLSGAEKNTSNLTIFEADTMEPTASFAIAKNPGLLNFSGDNSILLVAGYGYQKGFDLPTPHHVVLKQPSPAGASIVDLATMQSKEIDLGAVNQEFIAGENATMFSIANGDNNGVVKAIGPEGLLWEKRCDFCPQFIQEKIEKGQVFIIGGKKMSIVDKQSGATVKDLSAENDLMPLVFVDNSNYAYAYNMSKRKLNVINLDKLEIEKTMAAGSTGLAIMKSIAIGLSSVAYFQSLQPQYVNGVRIPSRISQIYWVYAPKGNIVACPEQNKLFMLNSFLAEIYIYDMRKDLVAKKLGYLGEKTLYLQLAPNKKYVILVSGDKWKLINTETDQAVLTFNPNGIKVRLVFQEVTAPTPYFSPDGNRMYVPNGSKIMVIDLQNGKQLNPIHSKTKDALVCW